jgi:RNA polymerase sigma factor (sigma-70 family)
VPQTNLAERKSVSLLKIARVMIPNEFEEIVLQHYKPLYRFAFSLARTESDAGDLTQHAFYVWATKGHQLQDRSKVKTWLFTTLHRSFQESRRRQTRFPHHGLDEIALDNLPTTSPACPDILDSSQVLAALARVDEIYQAAVALFYLEDRSYKEISEILQVPIGTVKSRMSRGITQLREILGCTALERPSGTVSGQGGREPSDGSGSAAQVDLVRGESSDRVGRNPSGHLAMS